jgi:hypothetical protein
LRENGSPDAEFSVEQNNILVTVFKRK